MGRPKKAPAAPVTADHIDKAAGSTFIHELVATGQAFTRAGIYGPFVTQLPILASVHIADKGYRRINVPAGTKLIAGSILLGKKAGLIFRFMLDGEMRNTHGVAEWVEIGWDDVINIFEDLSEKVEDYLKKSMGNLLVSDVDGKLKAVIARNASMHKVLSEGMVVAQARSKQNATVDQLAEIPGFGSF